ncbi:MAG: hypothetical protein KatS3mg082_3015 [Nitrospiraceae bacterium]|nr:MAG: hypothetical protein KatS3mg082_3015 [Nitrospiraceae bacterium]
MLRYMLDVESRGSASLLNIDRFEDPFNYKLDIATGTAGETKPTVVDLVETFNYLHRPPREDHRPHRWGARRHGHEPAGRTGAHPLAEDEGAGQR